MTSIQQLMQTGPAKAHDILAKLADTSPAAARTRDRLLSDLKVEFERQAEFEEQRLFPVLKGNNGTKDLVAGALDDSQQMRRLLGELERSPKDGEAFFTKVAAFRDLFQRRFRDNGNEILPAVVTALNDAQTGTALEKTEGGAAGITPTRRADGGEPLTNSARQSAEIMKAGLDLMQQGARVARRAMTAGTDPAGDRARAADETREAAPEAASAGGAMMALFSEQARHALQAQTAMAAGRVRTLAEMAQVQSAFLAGSLQRMGQFNDRYRALLRGWRIAPSVPSARR